MYLEDFRIYDPPRFPFIFGLDPAQRFDYTAFVLVQKIDKFGDWDPVTWSRPVHSALHVRYLHRFPRNTTYPDIVDSVCQLLQDPRVIDRGTLVIDATGVGSPVVDMFRRIGPRAALCPVVITAGEAVAHRETYTSVPKKDLVTSVAIMLQQKALVIPRRMPFADTLIEELVNFRSTIQTSGSTAYGAWRERDHDDLVLAIALACWRARIQWPDFNSGRERQPCPKP